MCSLPEKPALHIFVYLFLHSNKTNMQTTNIYECKIINLDQLGHRTAPEQLLKSIFKLLRSFQSWNICHFCQIIWKVNLNVNLYYLYIVYINNVQPSNRYNVYSIAQTLCSSPMPSGVATSAHYHHINYSAAIKHYQCVSI